MVIELLRLSPFTWNTSSDLTMPIQILDAKDAQRATEAKSILAFSRTIIDRGFSGVFIHLYRALAFCLACVSCNPVSKVGNAFFHSLLVDFMTLNKEQYDSIIYKLNNSIYKIIKQGWFQWALRNIHCVQIDASRGVLCNSQIDFAQTSASFFRVTLTALITNIPVIAAD